MQGSDKCTHRPCFTHYWPFYTLSVYLHFLLPDTLAQCLFRWHSPTNPLQYLGPSGLPLYPCLLYLLKMYACLQGFVSVYSVYGFPLFLSILFDKVHDQITLLEEVFSYSHKPSSSSVTSRVWFSLISFYHFSMGFVSHYILAYSFLLVLLSPLIEKVLDQIPLIKQTFSLSTYQNRQQLHK